MSPSINERLEHRSHVSAMMREDVAARIDAAFQNAKISPESSR
jgi:hypothetical protein